MKLAASVALFALVACGSPATNGPAIPASNAAQSRSVPLTISNCHDHRRFIKRDKLINNPNGWPVNAAIKHNYFTKIRVWNKLTASVTITPQGSASFTVPARTTVPPKGEPQMPIAQTKSILVVLNGGAPVSGPGVEVNNTSCTITGS